jgi:peptide/nickel transport system permease protein
MATIVNHDVLLEDGPAFTPLHPGTGAEANEAAGQWTLIWHKFTRNKVAVFAGWVVQMASLTAMGTPARRPS